MRVFQTAASHFPLTGSAEHEFQGFPAALAPLALLSALLRAGCRGTPDPGNTSRNGTRQVNSVEAGVVESVRVVTTESRRRKTPDGQGL
ncbi:MAG: hypothetical protein LH491_03855, partial [Pseudoxanthomonas sp.]|nr:hypothetical protein [Pseudoxanthomonas sp.]